MKKIFLAAFVVVLTSCANDGYYDERNFVPTPTVDYIEGLDVNSAPHKDSFLHVLAMNYRSYAIYNARTSGFPDVGEIFAQKSVAAFSGETPFPETVDNWRIDDPNLEMELRNACHDLVTALKNDAADDCPEVAAEAQVKFDCWISASATGQQSTANDCRDKFGLAMARLNGECPVSAVRQQPKFIGAAPVTVVKEAPVAVRTVRTAPEYYPDTNGLVAATAQARARDGIVIVNNVNVPQNLIQPTPIVFTQNIVNNEQGGARPAGAMMIPVDTYKEEPVGAPEIGEELVSRDEFINMMMALREELRLINNRLDNLPKGEKTILKVQQIPLTPKQHIMEEIMEVHFDFDKSKIKPEYEDVIRKLVETTRANKNVRVSVVGHTDTVGSSNYNYALGGRRAESVQQMLVRYGIPKEQIVTVSAGKNDNKVQTGPGVKNAQNRRVQVVTETKYEEPASVSPANMYGVEVLEPMEPSAVYY